MRVSCLHEKGDLLRPGWVDDEVYHGEEQASSKVSVAVIRANDTKLAANTRVSKRKVTQQSYSTRETQSLSRVTVANSWSLAKKTCSRL